MSEKKNVVLEVQDCVVTQKVVSTTPAKDEEKKNG